MTPAERLALAIRYLATGNSQISLSFNFRLGKSTVCHILRETCEALVCVFCVRYCGILSCSCMCFLLRETCDALVCVFHLKRNV